MSIERFHGISGTRIGRAFEGLKEAARNLFSPAKVGGKTLTPLPQTGNTDPRDLPNPVKSSSAPALLLTSTPPTRDSTSPVTVNTRFTFNFSPLKSEIGILTSSKKTNESNPVKQADLGNTSPLKTKDEENLELTVDENGEVTELTVDEQNTEGSEGINTITISVPENAEEDDDGEVIIEGEKHTENEAVGNTENNPVFREKEGEQPTTVDSLKDMALNTTLEKHEALDELLRLARNGNSDARTALTEVAQEEIDAKYVLKEHAREGDETATQILADLKKSKSSNDFHLPPIPERTGTEDKSTSMDSETIVVEDNDGPEDDPVIVENGEETTVIELADDEDPEDPFSGESSSSNELDPAPVPESTGSSTGAFGIIDTGSLPKEPVQIDEESLQKAAQQADEKLQLAQANPPDREGQSIQSSELLQYLDLSTANFGEKTNSPASPPPPLPPRPGQSDVTVQAPVPPPPPPPPPSAPKMNPDLTRITERRDSIDDEEGAMNKEDLLELQMQSKEPTKPHDAPPAPPPPVSAQRNALLSQIQAGTKLKKTEGPQRSAQPQASSVPLNMDLLNRVRSQSTEDTAAGTSGQGENEKKKEDEWD